MTNSPEHVQTLAFAPEGDVFNFAACAAPGARLVLVSNLKKQAVYAVHFAEGARGFDYVAEFSTAMPVLSFTALREDADDAAGGAGPGGALQLYCMQTQAIQQYALAVDRCRPAACADARRRRRSRRRVRGGGRVQAEEEEAAAARWRPAPATPPAAAPGAAKQDSASVLTPTELMSMAAGEQDVKPSAEKPAEEPTPKVEPARFAKSARVRPAPPPPGPPPGAPRLSRPPPATPPLRGMGASGRFARADLQRHLRLRGCAATTRRRARRRQLLGRFGGDHARPARSDREDPQEEAGGGGEMGKAVTAAREKGGAAGDADAKALAAALPKALTAAMTATVVPNSRRRRTRCSRRSNRRSSAGWTSSPPSCTQKENAIAAGEPLVRSLRGALTRCAPRGTLAAHPSTVNTSRWRAGLFPRQLESRMDPTVALGAAVDAGDFEGAFTKALGLSSVDLVAWTCSRAEARREAIFSSAPVALSQGVLLSLAQQLSSDLEEEPELKIAWIRDAALAIDPSDAALAAHMRPILEAVFAGLHACATAPETPAPVKNDLRLCIHVVNSLLTACK